MSKSSYRSCFGCTCLRRLRKAARSHRATADGQPASQSPLTDDVPASLEANIGRFHSAVFAQKVEGSCKDGYVGVVRSVH